VLLITSGEYFNYKFAMVVSSLTHLFQKLEDLMSSTFMRKFTNFVCILLSQFYFFTLYSFSLFFQGKLVNTPEQGTQRSLSTTICKQMWLGDNTLSSHSSDWCLKLNSYFSPDLFWMHLKANVRQMFKIQYINNSHYVKHLLST
jgi:hypothetical protein